MTTLFDALYSVARLLAQKVENVATGGSATTLVYGASPYADDYFNGGTILFLSGNNASKSATITDFAKSTGTFTFATQAGLCAAGNRFLALSPAYPREELVGVVNSALTEIGKVNQFMTTTIVADQEQYTLPEGVNDVRRVEIAQNLTSPYGWTPHFNWNELAGNIFFTANVPSEDGYLMRVWHCSPHASVSADDDVIAGDINPGRLAITALWYALSARSRNISNSDVNIKDDLDKTLADKMREEQLHPVRLMAKDPKVSA